MSTISGIRAQNGNVYSIRSLRGYTEAFTTIVLRSSWGMLRGFTYRIGDYVTGANVNATRADTNLGRAGCFEDVVWVGLEWSIPLYAPARFQLDPALGDYPVTAADIVQFVNKAVIRLFLRDEKPFVDYPVSSVDVVRSELRVAQQIRFKESYTHSSDRSRPFFVEIEYPTDVPVFGQYPSGKPGVLVIVFKLLEQLAPQTLVQEQDRFQRDMQATIQGQRAELVAQRAELERTRAQVEASAPRYIIEAAKPLLDLATSEADAPVPGNVSNPDADGPIDEARFRGLKGEGK